MVTWAERIRALQASGMTLKQIGESVGLSTSSVSDIANDRSSEPRGDAAVKLHELHRKLVRSTPRKSA
jgi:transcriptional regulator with XRE-family HTH domain